MNNILSNKEISEFKKNGAISGPVAPINTELNPLIPPAKKKDFKLVFCLDFLKNKYHIIKTPIRGFKKSTVKSSPDPRLK